MKAARGLLGSFLEKSGQPRSPIESSIESGTEHAAPLRLLIENMREPVVFVDTAQICRQHNEALAQAVGLDAARIDGRSLHEVLGTASYTSVRPAVESALRGETARLRQLQRDAGGRIVAYDARYVPHVGSDRRLLGAFVLLSPWRGRDDVIATPGPAAAVASAAGRSAPLSPVGILSDWNDPRERFLEALERDRFDLLLQPIVALDSQSDGPRHHEVLIRLQDEERNMMAPGSFFPVVMRYRLMGTLDRWVVRHVLAWYRGHAKTAPSARFCVNLSTQTLCDPSFVCFVKTQLGAHRVSPQTLCFEIAERELLAYPHEVRGCAEALHGLGCHIAIDEFGSAAGCFDKLASMPLDFLKIDGAIINGIERHPGRLAKVKALTKLAHAEGVRIVAQCVETEATVEKLRLLGVDYVQGFGVAAPAALDEFPTADLHTARIEQIA